MSRVWTDEQRKNLALYAELWIQDKSKVYSHGRGSAMAALKLNTGLGSPALGRVLKGFAETHECDAAARYLEKEGAIDFSKPPEVMPVLPEVPVAAPVTAKALAVLTKQWMDDNTLRFSDGVKAARSAIVRQAGIGYHQLSEVLKGTAEAHVREKVALFLEKDKLRVVPEGGPVQKKAAKIVRRQPVPPAKKYEVLLADSSVHDAVVLLRRRYYDLTRMRGEEPPVLPVGHPDEKACEAIETHLRTLEGRLEALTGLFSRDDHATLAVTAAKKTVTTLVLASSKTPRNPDGNRELAVLFADTKAFVEKLGEDLKSAQIIPYKAEPGRAAARG